MPTRLTALLRVRMGSHDSHYAGGLVDGARILELFGDLATELSIRCDGDEGLFRAYESVEFTAPVFAGDFVEARGEIIGAGRSSRRMVFHAHKVIAPSPDAGETAAEVLDKPVLVAKAFGTTVTPTNRQRNRVPEGAGGNT